MFSLDKNTYKMPFVRCWPFVLDLVFQAPLNLITLIRLARSLITQTNQLVIEWLFQFIRSRVVKIIISTLTHLNRDESNLAFPLVVSYRWYVRLYSHETFSVHVHMSSVFVSYGHPLTEDETWNQQTHTGRSLVKIRVNNTFRNIFIFFHINWHHSSGIRKIHPM